MAPKIEPARKPTTITTNRVRSSKKNTAAGSAPKSQRVSKSKKPIASTGRAKKAAGDAVEGVGAANVVKEGSGRKKANLPTNAGRTNTSSQETTASKDETTAAVAQYHHEQAQTLRYIHAFLSTNVDKHFINITVDPLTGHENWDSWEVAIELALRIHQVWPALVGEIQHLDPAHEMFVWYERMVDVTIAVLWENVSREIRENACFLRSVQERNPGRMMLHLQTLFEDKEPGVDICRS